MVLPRYDTFLNKMFTIWLRYDTYIFVIYLYFFKSNFRIIEYIVQKRYKSSSISMFHDIYLGDCIMTYRDTRCTISPLQYTKCSNNTCHILSQISCNKWSYPGWQIRSLGGFLDFLRHPSPIPHSAQICWARHLSGASFSAGSRHASHMLVAQSELNTQTCDSFVPAKNIYPSVFLWTTKKYWTCITPAKTHWPLGDLDDIFKLQFSILF